MKCCIIVCSLSERSLNLMNKEELNQKLQNADLDRIKSYLEILDRLFLRCLVDKILNNQDVISIIDMWKKQVKAEINLESSARSDFLMKTPAGRLLSSQKNVEDGESLMLTSLNAIELAKEIAKHNYLL